MLDGVTVLHSTDVYVHVGFGTFGPIYALFMFVLFLITIGFSGSRFEKTTIAIGCLTFCCVIMCIISVFLTSYDLNTYDYTKYEVIVNDDIGLNEFSSKYEILEYTDRTYIIRERDNT